MMMQGHHLQDPTATGASPHGSTQGSLEIVEVFFLLLLLLICYLLLLFIIVEAICHRYPSATEVNLSGVYNSEALAMEAMASLRQLETLILGKGQLGDGFFHALTECPALNSLSICDASLGNGIQEILVSHDRLRELNIVKCRVLRVGVRCPQL